MTDKSITKEAASKFLSDVPESNKFWCNDGTALSSLKELKNALHAMKKETFAHHVNESRNDFSNWINDVIGDSELAEKLRGMHDKNRIAKEIKKRVNELQKVF